MNIVFGATSAARSSAAVKPLPKEEKRTRPDFLLMAHPDHWYWDKAERCWLPDVAKLPISAGVGGVRIVGGSEDASIARAARENNRWVVVPRRDPRLSEVLPDGGEYRAEWPASPRGFAYGCIWEGYTIVRGQIRWAENRDLKVRFLRALVERGFLPPMSDELKADEVMQAQARVRRLEAQVARSPEFPELRARLAEATQLLADLQADLAGEELPAPPEPKPAGKARKVTP